MDDKTVFGFNLSNLDLASSSSNPNTPKSAKPDPQLYKTELCRSFNRTGYCRYGLKCQFAHGIHELRPSPRLLNQAMGVNGSFESPVSSPWDDLVVLGDSKLHPTSPRKLKGSPVVGSPRKPANDDDEEDSQPFKFNNLLPEPMDIEQEAE